MHCAVDGGVLLTAFGDRGPRVGWGEESLCDGHGEEEIIGCLLVVGFGGVGGGCLSGVVVGIGEWGWELVVERIFVFD